VDAVTEFRYRVRETTLQGERALILETEIPDDAPAEIKEGLARRAAVNAGGVCPCGARAILPNRAARRRATRARQAIQVTVPHEPDCLALLPGYLPVDLGPEAAS
jgi:acyl-CoA reductase-like NAD-dependent aldehyde dehydrogenase